MKLIVDYTSREAKMRAHTATHLLHFALNDLLGGTKQSGSLVDEDFLRFDFATKKALNEPEIQDIENKINQWIYEAIPVNIQEMSYDEAIQYGAKAFFEDKYGDIVRVVSIQGKDAHLKSIELCGGTHVNNTKNIGTFTILSQESVASGIRRITAITGPKVITQIHALKSQILALSSSLDCQPKQVSEKLQKFLKDYETLKANYESIQTQIISSQLQTIKEEQKERPSPFGRGVGGEGFILNLSNSPLEKTNFKDIVLQARQIRPQQDWLLFNNAGNFALYAGSGTFSAKEYVKNKGRKGGGSDQLVQGRDEKVKEIIG